jgi:hypothetical protein
MIVRRNGIGSIRHLAAAETSQFLLVGEIAQLSILSCDAEIGGTKDRYKMAWRIGFRKQRTGAAKEFGRSLECEKDGKLSQSKRR